MMDMSLLRRVTTGLVVVASLTACSPEHPLPAPTAAEIGGTWVNGETRLTLMQNKTFRLEKAPSYLDPLGDQDWKSGSSGSYNSSGTWDLSPGMLRLSGSKVTFPLYLGQSSSERMLEFGIDL